jgi:hypothetical protein
MCCHGCDGMVVGFTTTYATSVYRHWYCEFKSRSGRGVQYYVIKFVSDLRQVGGFHRVLRFSSTNKTDRHDITDILLKVTLNTIKQTNINWAVLIVQLSLKLTIYKPYNTLCKKWLSIPKTCNNPNLSTKIYHVKRTLCLNSCKK